MYQSYTIHASPPQTVYLEDTLCYSLVPTSTSTPTPLHSGHEATQLYGVLLACLHAHNVSQCSSEVRQVELRTALIITDTPL